MKDLAEQTGTSFEWPRSSHEADRQIKLLLAQPKTRRGDRRRERREVSRSLAEGFGDAATVREDELDGYGSTASWAGHHG